MTTDPERRARRPDRVLLPSRSIVINALRSDISRGMLDRADNGEISGRIQYK